MEGWSVVHPQSRIWPGHSLVNATGHSEQSCTSGSHIRSIGLCLLGWVETSVGACRFRQKWTTGCLTSATFAAPSRLRAVIDFGLRHPLPELPYRRGPSRCSEQDQQGSHWPVGHLLISHARNADASQLHPPRGSPTADAAVDGRPSH